MAMLADSVEVVIGVDTHKHTHTAAVLAAATGQPLASLTVATTPDGYQQLLELADQHHRQRVWAIEGTGGYGAGLTRFLHAYQEQVVELDRPKRAARRHGAKSDPLDATRAAREVLGRDQLAQPRATGLRAALSVRLTARRSAVQAAGDAQRQLHALVIAAPEVLRERLRVRSPRQLVAACPAAGPHRLGCGDQQHRSHAAELGPSDPGADRRGRRAPPGHPGAGTGLATRPAHPARCWPDRGRHCAVRLVPPWPLPHRCRLRHARRGRPDPGLQRPDRPGPAQPLRGPSAQPGPVHRGPDQAPHRPGDPRLRPAAPRPGQDQA
jgi:hypothetical protein